MEAAATTCKRFFLNRKLCTGLKVNREYSICLDFLTFKQLDCEFRFPKFQPPYLFYFFTTFRAVRYIYNSVQRELTALLG